MDKKTGRNGRFLSVHKKATARQPFFLFYATVIRPDKNKKMALLL
ncbi:hypothetical protein HMPREF3293_01680 [Christensenella minuta]|uniref:Uncharacterized protein n=1 Tax=Christensenella minuta TaxID=626937 RepID=A0A136Q4J3_9FIRM|nr:hypothetical protein HMPREF3293_01680 [Christensenella minuta]